MTLLVSPARAEPAAPPDLLTANPAGLAAITASGAYCPMAAGFKIAVDVYAGADERLGLWSLEGVMTHTEGRRLTGAATLVLNGATSSTVGCGLVPPWLEIGTLRAGDQPDCKCWDLLNTTEVRPVPPELLELVRDNKGFNVGRPEVQSLEGHAYSQVLIMAYYTAESAFFSAADKRVTWLHLDTEPEDYRGKVVRIEGRLRGLRRWKPPREARAAGVSDLYEGWVQLEGPQTCCTLFTELPPGLDVAEKMDQPVAFAGYFFKRYPHDDRGKTRYSPLLIGHAIRLLPPAPEPPETTAWTSVLGPLFVALVALTLGLVVGLAWWFRRTDQRFRRRLLEVRQAGEFTPPAPESVPLARPVKGDDRGSRIEDRAPGNEDRGPGE